jgi:hypothetical protein
MDMNEELHRSLSNPNYQDFEEGKLLRKNYVVGMMEASIDYLR